MSKLKPADRLKQMMRQQEMLTKRKQQENNSSDESTNSCGTQTKKFCYEPTAADGFSGASVSEMNTETSSSNANESSSTNALSSTWFQDALKRAKAKALELNCKPVSLSEQAVSSTHGDSNLGHGGQAARSFVAIADATSSVQNAAITAVNSPVSMTSNQQKNFDVPDAVMNMVGQGQHMEAIQGIMISKLTRTNPAIQAYALKVFGSMDLTGAQWRQCEEQMKMNIVFQLLKDKKKEAARLESAGRVKYEYDSDEDTEGGTWEHKKRKKEMIQTAKKAEELTSRGQGKHHIGDFLPPDELANFMEKYQALKDGRDPDLSDYKDHKLTEDNVGYRMLRCMGWMEGSGLGADGKGITKPVNQKPSTNKEGLGTSSEVHDLSAEDDEFDAYRKRMMLAYRFRPNPLNNPRRSYY